MYIDLTQPFSKQMPVYPGDPPSGLQQIATLEKDGFNDHCLNTGLHVGTHIDAPLHMLKGGTPISDLPLEGFTGRGVCIQARNQQTLGAELVKNIALQPGDFVFFDTGFSEHFGKPKYFEDFPEIAMSLAEVLVQEQVTAVGTDTPSPDREPFEIHKKLLPNGVLIIENLTNLAALGDYPAFEVIAFPLKLEADAAPVRVVAKVTN